MQTCVVKTGELPLDSEQFCYKKECVIHIACVFSSGHCKFLLSVFLTYKYCFVFPHRCSFPTKIGAFE